MALIEQLESYRDYKDDWDGVGSLAPKPELIDYAIWVVTTQSQRFGITEESRAYPIESGGINIEWWDALKRHREIEIEEAGRVVVYMCRSGSCRREALEIPMEATG